MIKPNYESGNIVNLVNSILKYYNIKGDYPPLSDFDLPKHKQLVFMVIDGMGLDFLEKHGADSFLYKHLKMELTSVFPSTTSAALTTLMTGTAPQMHGLTGWYMYFRELATAGVTLPFSPRFIKKSFSNFEIDINEIFDFETIFQKIDKSMMLINPQVTIDSPFSNYCYAGKPKKGYTEVDECFSLVKEELEKKTEMIYVYIPHFDDTAHKNGINSSEARELFKKIDESFKNLIKETKNPDTLFIVTADHGLIDATPDKIINLDDYHDIQDCLILPICGDPRVAYCYVRPYCLNYFRKKVDFYLSHACRRYSFDYLFTRSYFGKDVTANQKFLDRIGDEILIMKDNYVLYEKVWKEEDVKLVGFHGGLSREEMIVPLIVV